MGKPSDIYSLGIIAVELYSSFTTLHERIRCLTELRQGIFPDEMHERCADELVMFARMLHEVPSQRPTARAVVRFAQERIARYNEESKGAVNKQDE